jgi:vacuolar protein sorting-associated protein 18
LELPGNLPHSELHYFTPNADQALSLPQSLAWMTGPYCSSAVIDADRLTSQGPGIYHGSFNFESKSDDFIDAADVLPYPTLSGSSPSVPPEIPISITLTEFHFIILYRDRIVGVCHLDNKLAYEELLSLVSSSLLPFCCTSKCLSHRNQTSKFED